MSGWGTCVLLLTSVFCALIALQPTATARRSPLGLLGATVAVLVCNGCLHADPERPNLGVADEKSELGAAISLREIRIRNLGTVPGEGVISVAVIDSLGTALVEFPLRNGAPVHVPAANLGGAEGHVESISAPPVFEDLVDSLIRTGTRFGLRARIATNGGDKNDSDNVKTREWGPWLPMTAGADVTMKVFFVVPSGTLTARVHRESVRVPPGARVVSGSRGDSVFLHAGLHYSEIRLLTPEWLPHGSVFVSRVTLTDSATGQVLQQHERIAVYDTIPPVISSYRAVLFCDGRLAVQLQAGDRHAGVPEGGAATRYSIDGGTTWNQEVHHFAYDDFGRPALFETILGPFSPDTELLIGVSVRDMIGNTSVALPAEAIVLAAPRNAERAIETFGLSRLDGNPVFAPVDVQRRARAINDGAASHDLSEHAARASLSADQRFELKRVHELRTVPEQFHHWGVDMVDFRRVNVERVRLSGNYQSARSVLRIRPWKR